MYGIAWDRHDTHLLTTQADNVKSELYDIEIADGTLKQRPEAGTNVFWPTLDTNSGAIAWTESRDQVSLWRKDLSQPDKSLEPILPSSRSDNYGHYSPDGKHIVFDSDRSGTWMVWLADADGNNLTQLSQGPAGYPQWSPDSRWVAYYQTEGDTQSVYVVNIEERAPKKLLTKARNTTWPFWSPDGKWVYFRIFLRFASVTTVVRLLATTTKFWCATARNPSTCWHPPTENIGSMFAAMSLPACTARR